MKMPPQVTAATAKNSHHRNMHPIDLAFLCVLNAITIGRADAADLCRRYLCEHPPVADGSGPIELPADSLGPDMLDTRGTA
jgi:hypothetical protein